MLQSFWGRWQWYPDGSLHRVVSAATSTPCRGLLRIQFSTMPANLYRRMHTPTGWRRGYWEGVSLDAQEGGNLARFSLPPYKRLFVRYMRDTLQQGVAESREWCYTVVLLLKTALLIRSRNRASNIHPYYNPGIPRNGGPDLSGFQGISSVIPPESSYLGSRELRCFCSGRLGHSLGIARRSYWDWKGRSLTRNIHI